jgi:hypothetical protein
MIAVTGMHRSGTSCFAGLLERCGLSLGTAYPLLNESRSDNEKGHFENLGAVAINETILRCAGGSWSSPPDPKEIASACERFAGHMRQFSSRFDGDLFKDPRTCLTIAAWEKNCAENLEYVVLCLRHPVSVALSLQKRDQIPVAEGMNLWFRYNQSLLTGISKTPLVLADYDCLRFELSSEVQRLLQTLGLKMSRRQVKRQTHGFYSERLNHASDDAMKCVAVPLEISSLYEKLRSLLPASGRKQIFQHFGRKQMKKFRSWRK